MFARGPRVQIFTQSVIIAISKMEGWGWEEHRTLQWTAERKAQICPNYFTRWHIFVRHSAVQLSSWDLVHKNQGATFFGGICNDLHNQTTNLNTVVQWQNNRTGEVQEHLIPLSTERKDINYMTSQCSGYFCTSFSAMSVDGMYQGCIMRNMRTWEASFNVPDSSKIKRQESCR